jgi:hypothetical protein
MSVGVALVALSLNPLLAGSAEAGSNTVASIVIDSVVGQGVPDGTALSQPSVLTAKDHTISVKVHFTDGPDGTGAAASFGKATDVALTVSGGVGGASVTEVEATDTSATLVSSMFSGAANNVKVTISVPGLKGKNAIPAATSGLFDVLLSLTPITDVTTNFTQQVTRTGGSACGAVDEANPYCATVILPKGAGLSGTSDIVLGTGLCDAKDYTGDCPTNSYVVELLADLSQYSGGAPATVILDCDKKFCGKGSIQKNVPQFAVGGNADLVNLLPCAAKGVAPEHGACVDYVQSTRDNAGDTHLWILFAEDSRMSCC